MSDQKKKAYALPTLQKRMAQGLPVDISQKDTFLGLITKATEWKKGGGIQLGITLFNEDGTKIPHQNGNEEVEISTPMGLDRPVFLTYTRAIFAEADQFTIDAGFDLEDLLERWVYVKLEMDKKNNEDEEQVAKWGLRLQVAKMSAIPVGEREMIKAMSLRVLGKPPKVLIAGGGDASAQAAPAAAAKPAPAKTAPAKAANAPAAAKAAPVASGAVDPNDPFGVGAQ